MTGEELAEIVEQVRKRKHGKVTIKVYNYQDMCALNDLLLGDTEGVQIEIVLDTSGGVRRGGVLLENR